MKFQKNLGTIERAVRIVIGIFLLLITSLAFVGPASGWALFGILGVFPLMAGIVGFCPRYALMGMVTCKAGQEQDRKKNICNATKLQDGDRPSQSGKKKHSFFAGGGNRNRVFDSGIF